MKRAVLILFCAAALAAAPRAGAQDDVCLSCHGASEDQVDAKLQVDAALWGASVHGGAGIGCESCHAGKGDLPHQPSDATKACADCHGDAVAALAESVHGHAGKGPSGQVMNCGSCHGSPHGFKSASDPSSPVFPKKVAETCGTCHADPAMAERAGVRRILPLAAYSASVHGQAVQRGEHAATCSACHGSHEIQRASDARSRVFHQRVPETCGQCHGEIVKVFSASVHGTAAAKGVREAPVCTDCHGEHRILGPADQGSPVYASNVPKMTCGRCHGDLRMTERLGLKTDVVAAFEDSFHGLAGKSGDASVANCASCHGVHDILPSADPKSHVNKENLSATCGSCHPGAGERFAIGSVHVLPEDEAGPHPVIYWVRQGYIWLIWLTIGGMLLHNLLDLRRKALTPVVRPSIPALERRERLNRGFRIAHASTALSFLVLVYTGFALKFPEAFWAAPLLAWEDQIGLRGGLHRIAAGVMIAAFVFHFVHIVLDRRARACIRAMLPTLHDIAEVRERLEWYLGKRKEMPHAPALGYIEKAEYLALIWGTLVMVATGFLLWFENFTLANFPKWVSDLATVVHFYEAVLATLAILVWHFYWVLFDPLVYPMDTAWFNGREVPGRTLERRSSVIEPKPKKA